MRTAYFDCFGGASGDMIVGALLDAGVRLAELRGQLAALGLDEYTLTAEGTTRGSLAGTKFNVHVEHHHHHHHEGGHGHHHGRNLDDILQMVEKAGYCERVDTRIRTVFGKLACAEAKAHGTTIDKVHFHEVGAVDSIVDIVGAVLALEILEIDRVLSSPIPMGSGTVKCAHGILPVPPPATAELMRDGVIAESDAVGELCTPTGAALMTALAESFCTLPAMDVESIGYGAGDREDPGRVNMLRVFVGAESDAGQADTAVELSANIDDTSGQIMAVVLEMALASGAMDAWATPITMKKSRPAVQIGILCRPGDADRMEELLLTQTNTIGVRRHTCSRTKLSRKHVTVETAYGAVRVKVSFRDGRDYSATPEFADCLAVAQTHHVAVKEVQAAATQAYRENPSA